MTSPYSLDDGEAVNAEHPDTFPISSAEARSSLNPGDIVKLIFRGSKADGGARVERMWVIVTERTADGYLGTLDNDPFDLVGVVYGDQVAFKPEHVIAIAD